MSTYLRTEGTTCDLTSDDFRFWAETVQAPNTNNGVPMAGFGFGALPGSRYSAMETQFFWDLGEPAVSSFTAVNSDFYFCFMGRDTSCRGSGPMAISIGIGDGPVGQVRQFEATETLIGTALKRPIPIPTPVPTPAGFGLLLSGLGLVAGLWRVRSPRRVGRSQQLTGTTA